MTERLPPEYRAEIHEKRELLRPDWAATLSRGSDQACGVARPILQKPARADAARIDLVPPDEFRCVTANVLEVLRRRRSRRHFSDESLSLEELSFLSWAVQGLKHPDAIDPEAWQLAPDRDAYRIAPAAGALPSFETYVQVSRVEGVAPGLYRYLPRDHQLVSVHSGHTGGDTFADIWEAHFAPGAITFAWTVIPARKEWRYTLAASTLTAMDAGHMVQNLYLAVEAIGCGMCAVGGVVDSERWNRFLEADGRDEFVFYLATVGRPETAP